jgi:hypothetical protein
LITRIYKALAGLFLMGRYSRQFDSRVLSGKRIAIVGPASSAINTNRGEFIDGYDVVIRVNKSALVVRDGKFKKDIGSKMDILCHSFFENEFSGGGPLDFDLYDRLGTKYVINPIPTFFGKRVTFNFYKKYLLRRTVYSLPLEPYQEAVKAFGQFRPTTGFCALKLALESDFKELFITGFTFFKTPYGDGYRDSLKDVAVNQKYIKDSNMHSPDIEYEEFKKMLGKNASKNIMVDRDLRLILAGDNVVAREISE